MAQAGGVRLEHSDALGPIVQDVLCAILD
jgi:hypothetical protein